MAGTGNVSTTRISTGEALANYCTKYATKDLMFRRPEDKGARLLGFFGFAPGDRAIVGAFAWAGEGARKARAWRTLVGAVCRELRCQFEDLKSKLGPKWAWKLISFLQERDFSQSLICEEFNGYRYTLEFDPYQVKMLVAIHATDCFRNSTR